MGLGFRIRRRLQAWPPAFSLSRNVTCTKGFPFIMDRMSTVAHFQDISTFLEGLKQAASEKRTVDTIDLFCCSCGDRLVPPMLVLC